MLLFVNVSQLALRAGVRNIWVVGCGIWLCQDNHRGDMKCRVHSRRVLKWITWSMAHGFVFKYPTTLGRKKSLPGQKGSCKRHRVLRASQSAFLASGVCDLPSGA